MPDEFYADNKPVTQGNITVHTIATPGHTPGCTSMFFEVQDKERTLRCGIHGGIGLNTLTDEDFKRSGLPVSLRQDYIDGLRKLDKLDVDICLPSHTNQVGILQLADQIKEDYNPYINPSAWHELMNERLSRVMEMADGR